MAQSSGGCSTPRCTQAKSKPTLFWLWQSRRRASTRSTRSSELAFRRGYLTILPKEGASVEGLIWSVTDHDESQLDCYEGYPTFYDKETMTVTDADGTPHEIMVYTMNAPYRDQLLPVSSRYNAVVLQGCLDAGISPQQFYDADEKYRKAYKARAAPVPKKHAPER